MSLFPTASLAVQLAVASSVATGFWSDPTAGVAGQGRPTGLAPADRVRLAEAFRLASAVREDVWPGWSETPFTLLLVTDSQEYLFHHPRPTPEFVPLGFDSMLGTAVLTRPRTFPTHLLATFSAVAGVPTVVVGRPGATGRTSTDWVLTLLHEHFHQLQNLRPDYFAGVEQLGLAHGDETGTWMLDFPFPYDSAAAQRGVLHLGQALTAVLSAPAESAATGLTAVRQRVAELRRVLPAEAERYFEFQLWQEGVARYIEYACARAAARLREPPDTAFRALADYLPYGLAAERVERAMRSQSATVDLAEQRRVGFYSIGAAMALALERGGTDWQRRYLAEPFRLSGLLHASRQR